MPIPKPKAEEKEDIYISRCISEIASEYDVEGQAYAICKGEWDKPTEMAKIPIEIVGDNEEKILEYLPEVKSHEMEDAYLNRCTPFLYPEYVDEQKAFSLCADKYERIITVSDTRRTNLKSMKAEKMSSFERNKLKFQAAIAVADLRRKGIPLNFADESGTPYPWDECIADQTDRYGDEETAKKVCGYIKSEYGS